MDAVWRIVSMSPESPPVVADAPPARANDNPAAPNAGPAFAILLRRLRFEVCFAYDIAEILRTRPDKSYESFRSLTLRFTQTSRKVASEVTVGILALLWQIYSRCFSALIQD
ncbi:MAG: hypothetical protein KGL96_08545, partial [Hyphomicrobiales bacterium]|nr:hypothetical protein [Hyphomicrobiales bacterium]